MKNETMSFKEIQKLWNSQHFLERLVFLMNKLKVLQDEAENLSELEFKKLPDNYKVQIYQVLN
jgi:hypothetical protein